MPEHASSLKQPVVASVVLNEIHRLLVELGAGSRCSMVKKESLLERELGLGSLERVELLTRLENQFHLQFPDQTLTEAETPADLVTAIVRQVSASTIGFPNPPSHLVTRDDDPVSSETEPFHPLAEGFSTLTHALVHYARQDPEKHQVLLYGDEPDPRILTYYDLWSSATKVAAGLKSRGLEPGQTVALMLPTGEDFFLAFLGTLLAGGVPVPIYPPFKARDLEQYAIRQSRILKNAEVRFLFAFREVEQIAKLLKMQVTTLESVLSVDTLVMRGEGPAIETRTIDRSGLEGASKESLALIQYTSGSTGDPKGVALTHENLVANVRAIGAGLDLRPSDVGVSWLPLYHDMGLIGSWLTALYFGVPIVILSPLSFLARPERWLRAIHRHRGTISPAPNFAYELCVRRIDDRSIEGIDLSSWRVALNGAEPISPETLERFTKRFTPYGFRSESLTPAYGLAECSVGLTMSVLGRPPRIDCIERDLFERLGEAKPVTNLALPPLRFVSEGRALPGHEVRIVRDGSIMTERKQGQIQFRGPSTMKGYYRNGPATRTVKHEDWTDTGDLGYIAEGELFVTSRLKDMIIKGGRNLFPQEIEEIVGEVPGIRRGCVASFGVKDLTLGTEKLVVVAETRESIALAKNGLTAEITAQISSQLGLPPDIVYLVPPQTVPKTSSGKIRRDACKRLYLENALTRSSSHPWLQGVRLLCQGLSDQIAKPIREIARVGYGVYAWLVVGILAIAGWLILLVLPDRDNGQRAIGVLRGLCRLALRLTALTPSIQGAEHFEKSQARFTAQRSFMLVSNHTSYIDPIILMSICPFNIRFVAKGQAAHWPVVGTFIRKCGFITVDREDPTRSAQVTDRIVELLRAGNIIHIFPEATFTADLGLRPFQMGAFKAAIQSGCSIIPVTLTGVRQVFRDGTYLLKRSPISVTVGQPLSPTGDDWHEMVRLRDAVREEFLKHCGESPLDLLLAGPRR